MRRSKVLENKEEILHERMKLLNSIIRLSEMPLLMLGIIWLALLIAELLEKSNSFLTTIGVIIWIIFIIDFILKFIIATSKLGFLKKNILTLISLIIPAFRILRFIRIFRLIRVTRGIRLVKVLGSFNRGMRSLSKTLEKRAVIYVVILSVIVVFLGAAGMYAFEKGINHGFKSFGNSLWWTAMLVMSMGTENWPKTTEGRFLSMLIAIYGLAVFGYITATIATFFIGKDKDATPEPVNTNELEALRKEILALKEEIVKIGIKNNQYGRKK